MIFFNLLYGYKKVLKYNVFDSTNFYLTSVYFKLFFFFMKDVLHTMHFSVSYLHVYNFVSSCQIFLFRCIIFCFPLDVSFHYMYMIFYFLWGFFFIICNKIFLPILCYWKIHVHANVYFKIRSFFSVCEFISIMDSFPLGFITLVWKSSYLNYMEFTVEVHDKKIVILIFNM
jgi:hypothetical protein